MCLCVRDESVCDGNGDCQVGRERDILRKQVAIIGGGIAGSSAAYYISKLLPNVDITIYEKEPHVCGRVQDTIINGVNVEVGGSIYHTSNTNVDGFVDKFNLTKLSPFGGSTFGIWDGKEFVFKGSNIPFVGGYVNAFKMIYAYGWSPYNLKNYLDSLMSNWTKLYDIYEPSKTVEEFFDKLDLLDEVTSRAPEHLEKFGISREFTRVVLGSMTRVNYNTDVEIMNSFGVAVSAIGSGDSVYSVKEGNKHICSNLVSTAKAISKYGHTVTSITRESTDEVKYTVATDAEEETSFDAVVVAVPLELASIEFREMDVDDFVFKAREYQEVHVTFIAGELNSNYFHTMNDSVPSMVLTIEDASIPFSSIGRSKNITLDNGAPVSKVFSRTELTNETINNVFVNATVVYKKMIHAYPILRPATRFVPIQLAEQLYYVNAMETVVSTIETETISAKNIARLLAKSWKQPYRVKL